MRAAANSPIPSSPTHTASHSDDGDVEILNIEDDDMRLAEKNIRIHTAKTAPKDKKRERHVKHDDCCGYCELYCNDKITDIKRREIEAWRQDIHHIMDETKPRKTHKTLDKQKLKFLKYQPLGSPDKEPGFRRIKTPRDLGQQASGAMTHFQSHKTQYQWKNSKCEDRSDLSVMPSRMADLSVQAQYDLSLEHTHIDDPDMRLVPLSRAPAVMSPAFSRDSLDTEMSSLTDHNPDKNVSSQQSYRSCSNELLNVVTIDDAIKHHRDKMINSSNIRVIESSRRPRNSPHKRHKPITGLALPSSGKPSRSVQVRTSTAENDQQGFRLHPESGRVLISRPASKFSSIAHTESTDLPISKPGTQMSDAPGMRTRTAHGDPAGQKEGDHYKGPMGAVHQAVDQVIGNRHIQDEQVRRGLYKFEKNYQNVLAAKPESRRFKKMNDHLRQVMQDDYIPDHKMTERLHRHNPHSRVYSHVTDAKPPGLQY